MTGMGGGAAGSSITAVPSIRDRARAAGPRAWIHDESSTVFPEASFHVDGAKKSWPSSFRRTRSQRARRRPLGTIAQVPAFQP